MAVVLNAGALVHTVSIQALARAADSMGGFVEVWATIENGERQAAILPLRGREVFSAMQLSARVSHKVQMRWFPGVRPEMRVLFGTRTLNIRAAINPEEANVMWELWCEEGLPA